MRTRGKRSAHHLERGTPGHACMSDQRDFANTALTLLKYRRAFRWAKAAQGLVPLSLLGAVACVSAGAWLSAEALLNQDVAFWLSQHLMGLSQSKLADDTPRTLKQVQASIRASNQTAGEALRLTSSLPSQSVTIATHDLLIPVYNSQSNCQKACPAIAELRVYRPLNLPSLLRLFKAEQYFRLIDRLQISEPEESEIITPLGAPQLVNDGSTSTLPLTELEQYPNPSPAKGVWFNLAGFLARGEATTSYGQIFYYNLDQARLNLVLNWSSPTGDKPSWQEVTGRGTPELVVNQTVGLDPEFIIYQVQPGIHTLRLVAISLEEPAIQNQNYLKGLVLARGGLWSLAAQWLKTNQGLKAAQAQIDLVRFHAQATRTQAEQAWMNPAQQVLADLIDGRFTRALQVFKASPENSYEVSGILQTDDDRCWNRISAALQVNPSQPDVIAWGTLILAAQHGKPEALAWLQSREAKTSSVYIQTVKMLKQLEDANAKFSEQPRQSQGTLKPPSQQKTHSKHLPKPNPKPPDISPLAQPQQPLPTISSRFRRQELNRNLEPSEDREQQSSQPGKLKPLTSPQLPLEPTGESE